jgi:hypothetical protein
VAAGFAKERTFEAAINTLCNVSGPSLLECAFVARILPGATSRSKRIEYKNHRRFDDVLMPKQHCLGDLSISFSIWNFSDCYAPPLVVSEARKNLRRCS